jgi:hypothetical protein
MAATMFALDEVDLDTYQKGANPPFDYWEDDHTALVHVLWAARRQDVLGAMHINNCDEIASRIMRSRWHVTVRAEGVLPEGSNGGAHSSLGALTDALQALAADGILPADADLRNLARRIWRSRWLAAARASGPYT